MLKILLGYKIGNVRRHGRKRRDRLLFNIGQRQTKLLARGIGQNLHLSLAPQWQADDHPAVVGNDLHGSEGLVDVAPADRAHEGVDIARRLGAEVLVVEFLDHILPGIDSEVARQFHRLQQKQGLAFKLSSNVTAIDASGKVLEVKVEPAADPRVRFELLEPDAFSAEIAAKFQAVVLDDWLPPGATLAELTGSEARVRVRAARPDQLRAELGEQGATVTDADDGFEVQGASAEQIGEAALRLGIALHELAPRHSSLEDRFFELMGEGEEEGS